MSKEIPGFAGFLGVLRLPKVYVRKVYVSNHVALAVPFACTSLTPDVWN